MMLVKLKKYICFFAFILLLFSCSPSSSDKPITEKTEIIEEVVLETIPEYKKQAEEIVKLLSPSQLAGQVITTGVYGKTKLSEKNTALLKEVKPGAVILFSPNIANNTSGIAFFNYLIREAAGLQVQISETQSIFIPPFIAIDHEGGSVFRFRNKNITQLPSAMELGRIGKEAVAIAGKIAGCELRGMGFSLNYAPVVECLSAQNYAFLQTRSYSSNIKKAASLSSVFAVFCQSQNVACTAKHFPGNGQSDPHSALPIINCSYTELEQKYILPFLSASKSDISAIMMSHVLVPAMDKKFPISLSKNACLYIRDKLNFDGMILSDDLFMDALKSYGKTTKLACMAINAGIDLIMVSDSDCCVSVRDEIVRATESGEILLERLQQAASNVIAQKIRFNNVLPANKLNYPSEFSETVAQNKEKLRTVLNR